MEEHPHTKQGAPAQHGTILTFVLYWLPVLVWMVVIFGASSDSRSVQHTDSLLGQLLAALHLHVTSAQLETLRWLVRKAAHMTEYAVLALLWWRALRRQRHGGAWSARTAAWTLAACILYAASDEFHQSFVKTRTPSVIDVMIDTGGAALALLLVWLLTKTRRAGRA